MLLLISATKLKVTTHKIYKAAFLLKYSKIGCVYVVWWMRTVDNLKRPLVLCTTLTGSESTVHNTNTPHFTYSKVKFKAIPLGAWTDTEGSRRLRLPDFKTIGT